MQTNQHLFGTDDVPLSLLPYLVGWGFTSFLLLGLALWALLELDNEIEKQLNGDLT